MAHATAGTEGVAGTGNRAAILTGIIGNVLEWYDFSVFAFFIPVTSQLFFPTTTSINAQLLSYAALGTGFLIRPLGSIVLGIYGDRVGRRNALAAAMFVMAVSTFLIGLLPTYETAGIIAPISLGIIRLVQGFSAGGEWGGSTTYIVEFAPAARRGFLGSWQQFSVAAGVALGSAMARLMNSEDLVSHAALLAWGWRIPFLLGILLGGVGVYLRWRLGETPKFREIERAEQRAAAPLAQAFTVHRRQTLNGFGITLHATVAYCFVLTHIVGSLSTVATMSQASALTISTIGLIAFIALIPIMGALSDRIGRKPMLMGSCIGYIVLAFPLFWMASRGSFALALVAQLVLVFLLALYAGPGPATYAEIIPTPIRYTALSIGYSTGVTVFGGITPFICAFLIKVTDDPLAPTFYLIAAAAVTLLVLRPIKETAFTPLR